jgi:hypothetical protein
MNAFICPDLKKRFAMIDRSPNRIARAGAPADQQMANPSGAISRSER